MLHFLQAGDVLGFVSSLMSIWKTANNSSLTRSKLLASCSITSFMNGCFGAVCLICVERERSVSRCIYRRRYLVLVLLRGGGYRVGPRHYLRGNFRLMIVVSLSGYQFSLVHPLSTLGDKTGTANMLCAIILCLAEFRLPNLSYTAIIFLGYLFLV